MRQRTLQAGKLTVNTTPIAPKPTVAVLGSCLTRDNFNSRFNPRYKAWFSVGASSNQMSLISLMADPVTDAWAVPQGSNDYDRRNLINDFEKRVLAELVAEQPEYAVIDLFGDIHFGVVHVEDRVYVTNNRWTMPKVSWFRDATAAGLLRAINIFDHHDEYRMLWRDAVTRFARFFAENLPNTTLVVNRGRNTDSLSDPASDLPGSLQAATPVARMNIARANHLWHELDEELIAATGAHSIRLDDVDFGTSREHPWGPFYVHLSPEYNAVFLGELQRIHLRDNPESALTDQQSVNDVVDAWHAKAARDTKTIAAMQQLISELRQQVKGRDAEIIALQRRRLANRLRRASRRIADATRRLLSKIARKLR